MRKQASLFEATDKVLDTLRDIEEVFPLVSETRKKVFHARRELQNAQDDYLKQGEKINLVKKFEIHCVECNETQLREEDYYLHLRQKHQYSDEDASTESNNPRSNYEQDMQKLSELLSTYTETSLDV